jgi:hypothetical protein
MPETNNDPAIDEIIAPTEHERAQADSRNRDK